VRDTLGILVSILCLLHCLVAPLILTLGGLGVLGVLQGDQFFHLMMLVPVFILALASFPVSCRHHQRYSVMITGFSGVLLLSFALYLDGIWELLASVLGAGLLVIAHWVNRRLIDRVALID